MKWSPQQDQALKAVASWLNDKRGPQVFRLFGFAGSGKSTLAVHLAKDIRNVMFMAFTGKAALVMRTKGCTGASTIHSAIYTPVEDAPGGQPQFALDPASKVRDAGLVVLDECSMVGDELARDLLSFGRRVLVLGDPFQLPPVKGTGMFTECQPDILLTEIHRQALDNPIIRLSMDVREGRVLPYGDHRTARIINRAELADAELLAADQILVGRNRTREHVNQQVRQLRGYAKTSRYPVEGERLICLRNERKLGLLNGGMWTTVSCKPGKRPQSALKLKVADEADPKRTKGVAVPPQFFEGLEDTLDWSSRRGLQEFTFGHAITVHKSQGSQFDNVLLFDESAAFREDARRWLYTGITRAAERITIVKG